MSPQSILFWAICCLFETRQNSHSQRLLLVLVKGLRVRWEIHLMFPKVLLVFFLEVYFHNQQVCPGTRPEEMMAWRQQGHPLPAGKGSASLASLLQQRGACCLPRRAGHLCAAWDRCLSSGCPMTPQSHLENQVSARELANLDSNQIKQLI